MVTQHACGVVFHPRTHCAACSQPVELADLTIVAGDPPVPALEASA